MKIFSYIQKKLNIIFLSLKKPSDWFFDGKNYKTKSLTGLIITAILFVVLGVSLHYKWCFPNFTAFVLAFLVIGVASFLAAIYFSAKMRKIISDVSCQPAARGANAFYNRYCSESIFYVLGPLLIIFIFGIGGCSMFGAIQITPTFIWVMMMFFLTVYISIIAYLQYIVLAIYIAKLAYGTGNYNGLSKKVEDCIPAQIHWVQNLTRLSHTFRTGFFTLGSAYIIAFSAFCYLPQMQADTSSPAFYLLWGIIFAVIVILFPTISILEYSWIKKIVEKLKKSFIYDLANENQVQAKVNHLKISIPTYQPLLQTICASQILNSKDYPIASHWTILYAASLSIFNFAAAIVTVFQGMPTLSSILPHIL